MTFRRSESDNRIGGVLDSLARDADAGAFFRAGWRPKQVKIFIRRACVDFR